MVLLRDVARVPRNFSGSSCLFGELNRPGFAGG
jgi:hypothetical protein